MKYPAMTLHRGIVIDRCQPHGLPTDKNSLVTVEDMKLICDIGFDHVKVLFTPSTFMKGDHLDTNNMWFVDSVIGTAVQAGINCLVCIHPEAPFKKDYLASYERFQGMLGFYHEWSAWLSRWSPDEIAFQLMTEPFANYTDWNELHPQIWQAVRSELPHHTLVLSGDKTGSIFGLITLIPVEDENVYYGYTSYDPDSFTLQSWNSFWGLTDKGLDYMGHLPYPACPEIVEHNLPEILYNIAPEWKNAAVEFASAYGRGDYRRSGDLQWVNNGFINRSWLDRRHDLIDEWRCRNGANYPVLCNEFGVMDHVMDYELLNALGLGVFPKNPQRGRNNENAGY